MAKDSVLSGIHGDFFIVRKNTNQKSSEILSGQEIVCQ